MVTEAHEDAEGELLARLRQKLGSRTPIVVTLDLHANVTRKMADNANALIAFRAYPHIDMYERAWQGAELLERAMRGKVRPVTVIARRPMLHGLDWGRTQRGPMAELIARGEALEAGGKALAVSICAGFALANIHDVGPSVTVTVDQLPTTSCPGSRRSLVRWRPRSRSTMLFSMARPSPPTRRADRFSWTFCAARGHRPTLLSISFGSTVLTCGLCRSASAGGPCRAFCRRDCRSFPGRSLSRAGGASFSS